MRKTGKKLVIYLLLLLLLVTGLTGCGKLKNTQIVLTTGLSGDELFKVGTSVCTLSEAMIYVTDYQNQYESIYGVEMWEHDFGGITLEQHVKNMIVSQLATIKAVTLLAKEYGVALSEQEEKEADMAAGEYFEALSEADLAYMDIKEEDVRKLYVDHALAYKVYEEITKDVNTEVSDDEARIITIQQIKVDSREKAEELLEELKDGREFMTLASIYSADEQITYTFGRGEKEEAYETAAFNLETDQVSEIIEASDGFYLLKCTNNFDREATEKNKVTMVEKRRDSIFGQVYEQLIAETPSQFHTKLWEKVHFEDREGTTARNFFEIYHEHFKGAS